MKTIKKYIWAISLLCVSVPATAQDEVEASVGVDLVSSYIWRGQNLGNASIQPGLGLSWKGLSLSAWGSVGLASAYDTKEFDLTLGYTAGGLNVGVTDYWFDAGLDPRGRYFKYDAHGTNHVFEGNIGYDFEAVSIQWYTNISGNDGVNEDGDRAYSSYVEITAPFSLASLDWEASVGAVPYATSFYGTNGFAITQVGLKATKEFDLKTVTMPVYMGISTNPCAQAAYFYAGIAFQLK